MPGPFAAQQRVCTRLKTGPSLVCSGSRVQDVEFPVLRPGSPRAPQPRGVLIRGLKINQSVTHSIVLGVSKEFLNSVSP